MKEYQNKHPERFSLNTKSYRDRFKLRVYEKLGSVCSKCGFSDIRAIQIDHVNGGGSKELSKLTWAQYMKKVEKSADEGTGEYQLLCANCNWIKRQENNEAGRLYF